MQRYNFFIIFAACNHTKLKMKIFQSSIFRAICAIVVGALLIKYPDDSVTWLTVAIGVLFLLSGIIALMAYLNAKKHASDIPLPTRKDESSLAHNPPFPLWEPVVSS